MFGASLTPGTINNYGQEVISGPKLIPDCLAAVKPDVMGFSGFKGLPGMAGGAKRRRGSRRAHKQRGGGYGFVSAAGAPVGAVWAGGLAPMSRIPSETANTIRNPFNPQTGGAVALTGAPVGGDNQAYYAPTAGYSNGASTWVGSTGSPALVQTPYDARAMNNACLKTGGARRSRKASRKGRKGSRKGRKDRKIRYMARGGGVKEDALKVLQNNNINTERFLTELINGRRANPTTLDGYTFKSLGVSVNFDLHAKKESDPDSEYVKIFFMSDH